MELFFDIDLSWEHHLTYGQRKYAMMPVLLIYFLLGWLLYYRRKSAAIIKNYKGKNPFTFLNITAVLFIIVVPILLIIKVQNEF